MSSSTTPDPYDRENAPEGYVWCDACGHLYPPDSVHAMAVKQEQGEG